MKTLLLITLLGALLLAPEVSAQLKKPTKEELAQAEARFQDGESYYKFGDYEKALEAYKESYLLSQEPLLLLNIGQCFRKLELWEEAKHAYEAFLRDSPDTPYRKETEGKIEEMKKLIAEQKAKEASAATQPVIIAATQPLFIPPVEQDEGVSPRVFYGLSGGSGATGLALGGLALGAHAKGQRLLDDGDDGNNLQAIALLNATKGLAIAGGVAEALAITLGVTGYVLTPRPSSGDTPKSAARLTLTPFGVVLSWSPTALR